LGPLECIIIIIIIIIINVCGIILWCACVTGVLRAHRGTVEGRRRSSNVWKIQRVSADWLRQI